jgi:hypothetical protein
METKLWATLQLPDKAAGPTSASNNIYLYWNTDTFQIISPKCKQ